MKRKGVIITTGMSALILGLGAIIVLAQNSEDRNDEETGTFIAQEQTINFTWSDESVQEYLEQYGLFGLIYDQEQGCFMFDDREVIGFIDSVDSRDGTVLNTFSTGRPISESTIFVIAERGKNGVLTGLREIADDEFVQLSVDITSSSDDDEMTAFVEQDDSTETAYDSYGGAFEFEQTLLDEYAEFGISVTETGDVYSDGKLAGFFWDADRFQYFRDTRGLLLIAERNTSGDLLSVREVTADEAEAITGQDISSDGTIVYENVK